MDIRLTSYDSFSFVSHWTFASCRSYRCRNVQHDGYEDSNWFLESGLHTSVPNMIDIRFTLFQIYSYLGSLRITCLTMLFLQRYRAALLSFHIWWTFTLCCIFWLMFQISSYSREKKDFVLGYVIIAWMFCCFTLVSCPDIQFMKVIMYVYPDKRFWLDGRNPEGGGEGANLFWRWGCVRVILKLRVLQNAQTSENRGLTELPVFKNRGLTEPNILKFPRVRSLKII